ncbi:hypothetical protein HID58_056337 [Brassica napus]|uniref:Uncharacterized protein n=2 Tax=Brassica TaxID=3705 RepID=A0ABQ8ANC8_BRANA|nr:hypothetical protein HID58_056337 [Brassica napus]VDC98491.1 unnamed protein product [Brassica oleracea]
MYHRLVCLVTLIILLFTGSSTTAFARIPYQSSMTKYGEMVWDQKMIGNIKIDVGSSNSRPARQKDSPSPPGANM